MLENLRAPPKGWRATHAPGPLPMLGRVIACRLEASEVAAFVMTLGKMVNTAERVTVPILVLFDEGAYLDDSSSTHQGDGDKKLTAVRRHRGIAVGWNVQSPATLPVPFWRLATDVYIVSALPSYEDARAAEKHCGLDRGALEFARRLERYQIVRIHRWRGIVPLWSQQ